MSARTRTTAGRVAAVLGAVLALAVLAYLGTQRRRATTFVVAALLLPYALAAGCALGTAQRVSSGIEEIFEDDSGWMGSPPEEDEEWSPDEFDDDYGSGPELTPDPGATGADNNDDGIPDDAYSGITCDAESSGEVQSCMLNGGEPAN